MDKSYFVMLKSQSGKLLVPLVEPNGDLAMFETPSDAKSAAVKTTLGEAFGFFVFDAEFDGDEV